MSKKPMDKPTKARLVLISIILIVDVFLIPWLIQLPFFVIKDINTAPGQWFKFGLLRSYVAMFEDIRLLKIFLVLQIGIAALILAIAWNVNKFNRKNKIQDGVGGPEASGNGEHGTSRWMTDKEKDISSAVWHSNEPLKKGGIIFGMEHTKDNTEKIWLEDDDSHTLIIGATRSGKTRKVLLPTIWEIAKARESMIIGDPKGELYVTTKDFLEKEGYDVIILNLREPLRGNQWNMLNMVNKAIDDNNVPRATELAWDIASTITKQTPSTTSEPIWQNGEESVIAALILLSAMESEFKFQRHMTTAYYLLSEYGQPLEDESVPLIDYIKKLPVRHPAKAAFATASIAPLKTRASFFTTALSDLRLFSDPNIADMTSTQDHDLESIGIKKTAVFLIVPDEKTTRNVLATLYVDQVYQSLVDLANKNGGRILKRVNLLFDEFGNLPAIPEFDKKLTVAAGRGMRFTIAVQDVAQLKKLYDKNAQTITGNCHNWIYIRSADNETTKLISELAGKYTIETENMNSNIQSKGHSFGMGLGTTGRALLMPDEVRRWSNKQSLVLRVGHFPARYPLPDLSEYRANVDFGFVPNSELDKALAKFDESEIEIVLNQFKDPDSDEEVNGLSTDLDKAKVLSALIIKKRWENVPKRDITECQLWLPDMYDDDTDDAQELPPSRVKSPKNAQMAIETGSTKVQRDPSDDSIQAISVDEIDLSDIFKSSTSKEDDEDKDFL